MATRVTLREIADTIGNPGSGLDDLLRRILKDTREERAGARKVRKYLVKLVGAVEFAIKGLDVTFDESGDRVAQMKRGADIVNHLEFVKDEAKHFGLGRPL